MLGLATQGLGHRFDVNRPWLFQDLALQVELGSTLALIGPNGSGKSTLLRILLGQLRPEAGQVSWQLNAAPLTREQLYHHISWMGPGIELYSQLSLQEAYKLHFRFKQCLLPSVKACLDALALSEQAQQPLQTLSSGQLQRAKLGLALFSHSALLALDEPTSNMDSANAARALELLESHRAGRTLLLASNLEREYGTITQKLTLGG